MQAFLSTLSLRRATLSALTPKQNPTISIHALLAESDAQRFSALHNILISIHALLAESDGCCGCFAVDSSHFYPRSPCGERRANCSCHNARPDFYPRSPCGERQYRALLRQRGLEFLSTLSLRRATSSPPTSVPASLNFYPRSPCGERRWHIPRRPRPQRISIHALLAESDILTS